MIVTVKLLANLLFASLVSGKPALNLNRLHSDLKVAVMYIIFRYICWHVLAHGRLTLPNVKTEMILYGGKLKMSLVTTSGQMI